MTEAINTGGADQERKPADCECTDHIMLMVADDISRANFLTPPAGFAAIASLRPAS